MERLDDLLELLSSLEKQTYRNFEVILVIEKSHQLFVSLTHHTRHNQVANTKLLFNNGDQKGLSAARNIGIAAASGEILAFIDDDAVASPGWLEAMVGTYQNHPAAAGVTGLIEPRWEKENMDWFPQEFLWVFACTGYDDGLVKPVRNGYGTNMSFRKAVFPQCGLFDNNLGAKGGGTRGKNELVGEDTEFSVRLTGLTGRPIVYNPLVAVKHRAYYYRLKRPFMIRRAYWEGYTKALFKRNYEKDNAETALLSPEKALLRRIVFNLIPSCLGELFRRPARACKRMDATFTILFFVGLGFLRGSLQPAGITMEAKCAESS
jgi:glycosyltransferase involved in cell wall biosynthesis